MPGGSYPGTGKVSHVLFCVCTKCGAVEVLSTSIAILDCRLANHVSSVHTALTSEPTKNVQHGFEKCMIFL